MQDYANFVMSETGLECQLERIWIPSYSKDNSTEQLTDKEFFSTVTEGFRNIDKTLYYLIKTNIDGIWLAKDVYNRTQRMIIVSYSGNIKVVDELRVKITLSSYFNSDEESVSMYSVLFGDLIVESFTVKDWELDYSTYSLQLKEAIKRSPICGLAKYKEFNVKYIKSKIIKNSYYIEKHSGEPGTDYYGCEMVYIK